MVRFLTKLKYTVLESTRSIFKVNGLGLKCTVIIRKNAVILYWSLFWRTVYFDCPRFLVLRPITFCKRPVNFSTVYFLIRIKYLFWMFISWILKIWNLGLEIFMSEILKILFFRMIKVDEISISPQSFQAPVRNKCIVYIHVVFLDSWISWFFDEFKIRFFGKCSESRTSDISKFFLKRNIPGLKVSLFNTLKESISTCRIRFYIKHI